MVASGELHEVDEYSTILRILHPGKKERERDREKERERERERE